MFLGKVYLCIAFESTEHDVKNEQSKGGFLNIPSLWIDVARLGAFLDHRPLQLI